MCQSSWTAGFLLKRVLALPDPGAALDDAEAARKCGGAVAVVPWDGPNPKLTRRGDLELLELLCGTTGKPRFAPPPARMKRRRR